MRSFIKAPHIFRKITPGKHSKVYINKTFERKIVSYPSSLTYVLGAQKNRLNEYPQHMFWLINKTINFCHALKV